VDTFDHTLIFRGVDNLTGALIKVAEPSRVSLSLAGQECVRYAVSELCGNCEGDIQYTDLGAPQWVGGDCSCDVYVSIAHTVNIAVGVASTQPIGVDIERSDRDVSRLFHSLSDNEQELVPRWSPLQILCSKEAAGKAQSIGIAGSIRRWEVTEQSGSLMVTDRESIDNQGLTSWKIELIEEQCEGESFTCAIALPPLVRSTKNELHEIYTGAQVEIRPRGASSELWQKPEDVIRLRKVGGVVITAWNPGQLRPSIIVNEKANDRLLKRLESTGLEIWDADGFSPDRTFREPGFMAWGMDPDFGCEVAREFGQFAIFVYHSDGSREVVSSHPS
jgi:phosphopantetheinyl transferase